MAKSSKQQDFEEAPPETRKPRRGGQHVAKLFFADGGGIDYDRTEAEHVGRAMDALSRDERYADMFKREAVGSNVIQDKHIDWFLTSIEKLEKFLIPRMVARKSMFGQPVGAFKIDADTAEKAFSFSAEQRSKIVPLGVETANANLPEKVKQLITKVGPGSEFLGRILVALQEQQVKAITLQAEKYRAEFLRAHPPGFSQPHPRPVPVVEPPQPPPVVTKPNGVSHEEETLAKQWSTETGEPSVVDVPGMEKPTA